jgi:hypothetical protein
LGGGEGKGCGGEVENLKLDGKRGLDERRKGKLEGHGGKGKIFGGKSRNGKWRKGGRDEGEKLRRDIGEEKEMKRGCWVVKW